MLRGRRFLSDFYLTTPLTLDSATPVRHFAVGRDNVMAIYEDRGVIVVRRVAGKPVILSASLGAGVMAHDPDGETDPPPQKKAKKKFPAKKRQPPMTGTKADKPLGVR